MNNLISREYETTPLQAGWALYWPRSIFFDADLWQPARHLPKGCGKVCFAGSYYKGAIVPATDFQEFRLSEAVPQFPPITRRAHSWLHSACPSGHFCGGPATRASHTTQWQLSGNTEALNPTSQITQAKLSLAAPVVAAAHASCKH
eukprot:1148683-Pelagomonas_calceolata.AAC.3